MNAKSTIIHIPHSATYIPPFLRKDILVSDEELKQDILAFTDWRTRDLFTHAAFPARIVYPVNRMVCDPERFRSDEDEEMAKIDIGVVYEKDAFLRPFRKHDAQKRELMLQLYYDRHHRNLTNAVDKRVKQYGECLLVDGHSFPATPLPYEPEQDNDRPDICIGTCKGHTPLAMEHRAVHFLEGLGLSVSINYPYSGAIVPMRFLGDPRVRSIMVEINRGLYRKAAELSPTNGYARIKNMIGNLLNCLAI